jgi:hypothetical protein
MHNSEVRGEALEPKPYVRVRWEWLTFLVVQILLSIVVLAMTIAQTLAAGIRPVKSNPLPTMFAIGARDRARLEDGCAPEKMQAEYDPIRKNEALTWTEGGWLLAKKEGAGRDWEDSASESDGKDDKETRHLYK